MIEWDTFIHLSTPTTATLALIPEGRAGVAATLKAMSAYVREYKKSMAVRDTAARVTRHCPQKAFQCEVQSLHAFVRDRIRYLQDVNGVETVQTPAKTLEMGVGDCDDKSTLLAALLESIGHPTRFMAIGFEPDVFSHVYVETLVGSTWVPLETTEPVQVGWEPEPKIVMARLTWRN